MHGRVINADKNNRINILIVGLFLKDLDVRTLLIQSAVTQIDIMRRYRLGNAACHFEVKCIATGGKGAQRGENSNAVDQQPPAGQRVQNPSLRAQLTIASRALSLVYDFPLSTLDTVLTE